MGTRFSGLNRNLSIIWLLSFVYFFAFDAFETVLPLYLQEVEVSASFFGILLFASNLLRVLTAFPVGNAGDTVGRKRILFILFLLVATALLLVPFTSSPVLLMVLAVIILSSRTPFNVTLNPMLAHSVTSDKRGVAFGIRDIFLYGGTTGGLLVAGYFVSGGFTNIFLLAGVLFLLALPLTLGLSEVQVESKKEKSPGFFTNLRQIRDKRKLLIFCIVVFVSAFAGSLIAFIPLRGMEMGISNDFILYAFAGSSLLAALLSYAGGKMTDTFNRKKLLLLSHLVAAALFLLLALFTVKVAFMAALMLVSILYVFAPVLPTYFFDSFSEEESGSAWGVQSTVALTGEMLAPLLWGLLWDYSFSDWAFLGAAGLMVVAFGVAWVGLPETKGVSQ